MKRHSHINELKSRLFTAWFEKVYEENFERLYRYAFSITKSKQLAEDVVSEVFLNIWSKKPDYTNIRELHSYLHVSVKHLAIRLASKDPQRFCYSTYDETLQISDAIDPENLLLGKELDEKVMGVIESLPPHCRLIYEMARNKGYSYKQIAEELGISQRTVESQMHKVLKKLKESLREHFKESDGNHHFLTQLGSLAMISVSALLKLF